MNTLGDRIKHFRNLKGLSQKELAKLAGVTQPVIAELELNNQRSTKKLVEIARALEVAAEVLSPDTPLIDAPITQSRIASASGNGDLEQALAVAEGAMLAAGLNPAHLEKLRELLRECLEEPLVLSNPESAADSRRNLARSVFSRFLKQHAAQDEKG